MATSASSRGFACADARADWNASAAPPILDLVDAAGPPARLLPLGFWPKAVVSFGGAALVARYLPHTGSHAGGIVPPAGTLLLCAAVIGLLTTAALWAVLRLDLRLPASVAVYATLFNLLVVAVKFGLAPHGIYQVNRRVEFDPLFDRGSIGFPLAAFAVFLLYAGALWIIYRIARARLEGRLALGRPPLPSRSWGVAGLVLVVLTAITGGGIALVLPLLFLGSGLSYLGYVFSSGVALLIALALGIATALAALAFRDAQRRAAALGDASVLVGFFWVALAFLALYHVLWVVYVLALTATWPLRTVAAK